MLTEKEYKEFVSLVRKMREAQIEKDESDQGYRTIPHICILEKKDKLESEVDEYLKKMDSIDKRKALEAENTEFDYGHNVKHYIEELWKI